MVRKCASRCLTSLLASKDGSGGKPLGTLSLQAKTSVCYSSDAMQRVVLRGSSVRLTTKAVQRPRPHY